MPSYRRDRPDPGERPAGPRHSFSPRREPAPPPPREREEAREPEEYGFPRRAPAFSREASQFTSRPVGPSERRELWEVLVPKEEQENPYFDYDQVFSMLPWHPRRGGSAPASGPGPGPQAPRGEAPRGGPQLPPQRFARGIGDPPLFSKEQLGQIFDLERIWNAAQGLRQHPQFAPGKPGVVLRTAPPEELPRFYNVAPADVEPLQQELAHSISEAKPRDLPGRFFFQKAKDGFVWLFYVE